MMRRITMLIATATLLLLTGVVLANGGPAIDWYVIGAGGGYVESNDSVYALNATVGQAVAGVVGADPQICAGFWCGMGRYKVYLPLVLRNS